MNLPDNPTGWPRRARKYGATSERDYSVAQVLEIREALEPITDEKHANNVSLASNIRESRVPAKVPAEMKRPEAIAAPGR